MSFQRIRDPLHNLIEFDDSKFERKMWQVIQTQPFQRLRRIKQLGFSELVYPGATHTRFAHSIGVFHTARMLMNVIQKDTKMVPDPERKYVALAASLVHDVGHGPFSHAFEDVGDRLDLEMADHKAVSDALIREGEIAKVLRSFGSGFASDVADLIGLKQEADIFSAVVSSQFDADRLDYMRRDRMMTGTHHGAIDFDWLLSNLEVGAAQTGVDEEPLEPVPTFVLGPKAIYAAETYVLALFQLYPTVYFHKATRGAEKIFSELVSQIVLLTRDSSVQQTGLPESHPLISFAKDPKNLQNVLRLDDSVVVGSLSALASAPNRCIATLAADLQSRSLYKCIDIRERIRQKITSAYGLHQVQASCTSAFANLNIEGFSASGDGKLQSAIRTTILDRIYSEKVDKACLQASRLLSSENVIREEAPTILLDEAKRRPYKPMQESKGPLEQILIRSEGGVLLDVATVSRVIAAVQDFKLLRAYVSRDSKEAEAQVARTIEEGVNYAMAS